MPRSTLAPASNTSMQVTLDIVDITHSIAREWLGKNAMNNRAQKPGVIAKYTRDMIARAWPVTGDTIKFNIEGDLIDGGQRMRALLRATELDPTLKFVTMAVAYNVPKEAMAVTDTGARRSLADALLIEHAINRTTNGAIVRRVYIWDKGNYADRRGGGGTGFTDFARPTLSELVARYQKDPEQFDQSTRIAQDSRRQGVGLVSAIGAAYYLLRRIDDQACKAFFEGLVSGAELPKTSPILLLRSRLIRATKQKRLQRLEYVDDTRRRADILDSTEQLYLTMKTWNAYRKDESLERLTLPPLGVTNSNFVLPI